MSLDNIQLPAIVLQDLFKYSLVDLEIRQSENKVGAEDSLAVLGNNARHTLIVVENSEAIYLPDGELNFLLGVLSACTLTMNDVAILNIKKHKQVNYKTLATQLQPEKLLLFGVAPGRIGLPLDFPNYQVQQFNSQTYLTVPALSFLQNDKAEKTKLWNCLKQVFQI
jgi:hypothetical protein